MTTITLSSPATDLLNQGIDAAKKQVDNVQTELQTAVSDKAKQVAIDYANNNPNKVRATVAGGVLIGIGAVAGIFAIGMLVGRKK